MLSTIHLRSIFISMSILPILKLAKSIDGPILDLGFGKGKFSYDVLELFKTEKLNKKDLVVFDRFQTNGGTTPKRHAIDFRTIAANYHKVGVKIVEGLAELDLKTVIKENRPSVVHIDFPTEELTKLALKKAYQEVTDGCIILVDTSNDYVVKVVNKFCKKNLVNFTLGEEGDFAYIIKGDLIKPVSYKKDPQPLAQGVGNKVKRGRSVNLT